MYILEANFGISHSFLVQYNSHFDSRIVTGPSRSENLDRVKNSYHVWDICLVFSAMVLAGNIEQNEWKAFVFAVRSYYLASGLQIGFKFQAWVE